jgi:hypothetical protein
MAKFPFGVCVQFGVYVYKSHFSAGIVLQKSCLPCEKSTRTVYHRKNDTAALA